MPARRSPTQTLKDALKFIADAADDSGDQPEDLAAQAYRLYVLALAGQGRPGAARVLAARIDRLPTPLAKAQLGAALALAHDPAARRGGLRRGARRPGAALVARRLRHRAARPGGDRGAAEGERPGRRSGCSACWRRCRAPTSIRTRSARRSRPGRRRRRAVLGRDGQPARIALDGKELPPAPVLTVALTGPATARNLDDKPVWQSVSVTGVPAIPLPAARSRHAHHAPVLQPGRQPLDLDHLKQNTVFVLLLEGRAEDGQPHQAMVQHGLPAGWEIAGRFGGGEAPGLSWLGKLSDPQAQPAADDRYAAVVELTPQKPDFRLAVRVRAVTPGIFELPGAEVADMYRPGVFARQAAGRVTVQGAE